MKKEMVRGQNGLRVAGKRKQDLLQILLKKSMLLAKKGINSDKIIKFELSGKKLSELKTKEISGLISGLNNY